MSRLKTFVGASLLAAVMIPRMSSAVESAFTQSLIMRGIQVPHKFHTSLNRLVREKPFWPKRPLQADSASMTGNK